MTHTVSRTQRSSSHPVGGGDAGTAPLRILHLLAPAPFGGLEQVVLALAGTQAHAGHDVHVALVLEPETSHHDMLPLLESRGVRTYTLVIPHRRYGRERQLVRQLCRRIAPQVVHTHGARSDVLHGPVARGLRIPTVSTSHGFTGGGRKNRAYEYLQRRAFRRCAAVVAVSPPMLGVIAASGVARDRLHCIPNAWAGGVDFLSRAAARAELGIPTDVFCAGFVGRIGHEKGPDVFLDAVSQLDSDAYAVLVGNGSLRVELEERTRALGLEQRVHWKGMLPNAARLIRAFDAVVLSSRTEGTPIVLLEAMAAEVPVIAARVGGIPHVVSEHEALLVPPEDPAALAAAMSSARGDPAGAAARAARAAAKLRAEYGSRTWLERYDRVYRACGAGAAVVPGLADPQDTIRGAAAPPAEAAAATVPRR
jgi:glycosyltransferase involved in cell wall biosynthesis